MTGVKSTGAYPPFLVTSHRLHVQGTFWLKDPKGWARAIPRLGVSSFRIYIPGSSWSWKFPQSQNRSILPNSREKELLNGYFHSRTLFLTPEGLRTVLNGFLTLFERFLNAFFHSRTSEVSGTAKTTLVFFFHTNPQNRSFLGLEFKNPVFGSSR